MKKIFNTDINENNINEAVELTGWVGRVRNLGGLIFIDLRDRTGIIQLVVNPESEYYSLAESLKSEYVITVTGKDVERININEKISTGKVEVIVDTLTVLNKSNEIPFQIADDVNASEETRLKYRYLDLRRPVLAENLILRHKITMSIRNYLDKLNFLEVETPILCKSTP